MNPSTHQTVLHALRNTESVLGIVSTADKDKEESMAQLPDTAVLLRRYLDSGRMINMYDWFESFLVAMQGEERFLEGEPGDDAYGAEWRREMQARFLLSVHELDWMGLVRSTGRKKDHVVRTMYDPR